MSYWNYRVLARSRDYDGHVETWCEVVEVYYTDDGQPKGWIPSTVMAETMEGLGEVLGRMTQALAKPVLQESDFSAREDPHENTPNV